MPRTVRDARLETRTARSRLKASGKPYYRALDPGLHLGYRKGVAGGKWVIRCYRRDGSYQVETIATADDNAEADGVAILDYRQAQALARKQHVERARAAKGLPTREAGPYSVGACISDYLDYLEANRKSARDGRSRAEALILPKLGDFACSDLTTRAIRKWLEGVSASPPRLRTRPGHAQKYRTIDDDDEAPRRRRATANRTLTILKAALNRAWREGKSRRTRRGAA